VSQSQALPSPPKPADVDGKSYDLLVVEGTGWRHCPARWRGAREGLSVLLVQHTRHIGGMVTNSLFQWGRALRRPPRSDLQRIRPT